MTLSEAVDYVAGVRALGGFVSRDDLARIFQPLLGTRVEVAQGIGDNVDGASFTWRAGTPAHFVAYEIENTETVHGARYPDKIPTRWVHLLFRLDPPRYHAPKTLRTLVDEVHGIWRLP